MNERRLHGRDAWTCEGRGVPSRRGIPISPRGFVGILIERHHFRRWEVHIQYHSVRAKDNARRDNSKVQGVDHVLDPWTTATRPTEANYEGPVCNRFIDILLKRIRASNQIFLIQEDKAKTRAAVRSQLGEGRKQRDSVGGPTATESLQFPFANEAPVRACQPALRVDVHVRPDRVRLRSCGKL